MKGVKINMNGCSVIAPNPNPIKWYIKINKIVFWVVKSISIGDVKTPQLGIAPNPNPIKWYIKINKIVFWIAKSISIGGVKTAQLLFYPLKP